MAPTTPEDIEVLTLASGVGIRLFRPAGVTGQAPALLWIHGGGYVIGKAAQDDAALPSLRQRTRRDGRVGGLPAGTRASVSRAAGGLLFGADVADAVAVGRSVTRGHRGCQRGRGLAAALALLTRDRGEINLAAQLLVYPMLDDRTVDRKDLDNPGLRLWNQSSNKFGWSAYLGDADPAVAVPARREDLSGLPPAWLGVGTFDLFHDEDLAYAERLKAAGVPCEVEVVPGAFHGFDGILPKAQVSQSFFNTQCAALREAFAPAAA